MAQFLVSIRELKSRLSHYLRLTRKGESVVITDRGLPIGRIVPMGHVPMGHVPMGHVPMGQDLDQRIAAMQETGLAHWSGRKLGKRKPVAKPLVRGSAAQLVVEDRESHAILS